MRQRRIRVMVGVLFCLLCIRSSGQTQDLVIVGGTLIDGTGRNPLPNAVIVVEGSRIKAVGAKGAVSYPQNARIIPADGKTILPGLKERRSTLGSLGSLGRFGRIFLTWFRKPAYSG